MGCVQGKSVTGSPIEGRQQKLMQQNGYVKGGGNGVERDSGKLFRKEDISKELMSKSNGVGGQTGKVGSRDASKNDVGNVSQRSVVVNKVGGDDLVGGWPKWLVDNIPKDVLVGLVPKTADSYDKLAKIGQGTYSNVYKARDRDTKKIVALKKVRFDTQEPESVKFMAREITILQKLDHPNVIKLEGLATSRMQYSLYLVFDFMQSDLTRIISRQGEKLTEPQIKSYMQQLLLGLQHCHEKGILHRDIKASNLLIDKDGRLKIADFGLAYCYMPKTKRSLTSRVVTLWYRAPELLLGSTDYGVGIDLWSAGCLLAEMFFGRPIMPGRTESIEFYLFWVESTKIQLRNRPAKISHFIPCTLVNDVYYRGLQKCKVLDILGSIRVEQLHMIFKLCGAPPEDYWKIMRLPTSFRPPNHYKPSFQEAFKDLPETSFRLITTLLSLNPAYRGTAASALQTQFFTSSPLPRDISGLPNMYKEEPEPAKTLYKKRLRNPKKKSSRVSFEGQGRKNQTDNKAKEDDGSSMEVEKVAELNLNDAGNTSSTSNSFTMQPTNNNGHQQRPSFSPVHRVNQIHDRALRTEAHPNAAKNIQNFTLLQASIIDIIHHSTGNEMTGFRRSVSQLDFRTLDPEKIKLYGLEENCPI